MVDYTKKEYDMLGNRKIVSIMALLSGCGGDAGRSHMYEDKIVCINVPDGMIISDDVYITKWGQPVLVRCPPNMAPKMLIDNGGQSVTPHVPPITPPITKTSKAEVSKAGGGIAAAGTKNELSVAMSPTSGSSGGAIAIMDGVSTDSRDAKKIVDQISNATKLLATSERQ
jgi:hypothetical protein